MSAQEQLPNSDARSEDWDRSEIELDPSVNQQNSVAFPGQDGSSELHDAHPPHEGAAGKRTLSELLKIYAEKGTDVSLNPEEASRVADVLKAWINSGSSPYEGEDDFFSRDDIALSARRSANTSNAYDTSGRPRGRSESVVSAAR